VGAAPRGHVRRGDRVSHGGQSRRAVLRLPQRADRRRPRSVGGYVPGGRLGGHHPRPGRDRRRHRSDHHRPRADAPRHRATARTVRGSPRGVGMDRDAARQGARCARRRSADRRRPRAATASRSPGGGGLLGVRHRRARSLLPRLWHHRARRCCRRWLFSRDAREPPAGPRRDRGCRGRDDRRLRRVRRSGEERVVAVLTYRAISFWLPTLPGLAGYLTLRSTVRRWRRDTADRSADAAGI
jgi:hypothetical protein